MPDRVQTLEIFAPTLGRKHDAPSTFIESRAMPDGTNNRLAYGVNQKDYGTSVFSTASNVGVPLNYICQAAFTGGSVTQIFSHTGVYRHSSTADTLVADGQTFTGTFTDFWNGVMHNGMFFYANGVDPIQVKSAFGNTGTNMASSLNVNTYKSWALGSLEDHLNLYHTVENGSEFPVRVRWTKKGVLVLTAATTDFGSGTAGSLDLQDVEGEIQAAVPLGVAYAIYSDRSIHVQTWIGGDQVYRFTKTISGIGTPARRGVASYAGVSFFIGQDSFYAYYGGDSIEDIGAPIRQTAYNEINRSELHRGFVIVDEIDGEVNFHVPTGASATPDVVWVYNLLDKSWCKRSRTYTAAGRGNRFVATTIGDLAGTIGDQMFKCGDYYVSAGATVILYGEASGRVSKRDRAVYSLVYTGVATPQVFTYVTPDLTAFKSTDPYDKSKTQYAVTNTRWLALNLGMTGNGVAAVAYSTDEGSTYTQYPQSPVTLNAAGTTHVLQADYTSQRTRIKVTQTGTLNPISISYVALDYVPGSPQ
jgi:hypothetical protein